MIPTFPYYKLKLRALKEEHNAPNSVTASRNTGIGILEFLLKLYELKSSDTFPQKRHANFMLASECRPCSQPYLCIDMCSPSCAFLVPVS